MSIPYPPSDPNALFAPPAADVPAPYAPVPPPLAAPQAPETSFVGPSPYVPQAPYAPQPPYAPPAPVAPPAPPAAPNAMVEQTKGFISRLFDFSFTTFITPAIVTVVYIIVCVVAVLGWLGLVVTGFMGAWWLGLLALLLGWIGALLMIIFARIALEVGVALIRTAENTSALKK